ncbi:MAG: cation:proton antiporter [Spirochaetales bacterium]|nr:MAG: cation:proton antiporter [Spirochaetales bacterium]
MRAARAWRVIRFGITSIALYAVWLLFTASLDAFSLITGAVGSVAIGALTHDVFIAEHEASYRSFMPNPFLLVAFLVFLIYSMYLSSIQMLVALVRGHASPRVVHFRTRLKSDLARMVLSNAITFTPGTITLDLDDDHLTVHWFLATTRHSRAAGEIVKGRFEGYLRRVWS